jgi:hypothetical protein
LGVRATLWPEGCLWFETTVIKPKVRLAAKVRHLGKAAICPARVHAMPHLYLIYPGIHIITEENRE